MVHDLNSGITTQVTGGGFNNINPYISGNVIVWQGWAGGSWDIFSAGKVEEDNGLYIWSVVRISENEWPDVNPHVTDGIVLWEALIGDSWQVFSYEIDTSTLIQISEGTGDNRNPRFVVLWDSLEDGETQLVQYDMTTNERSVVTSNTDDSEKKELPESPIDENGATMPVQENNSGTSSRIVNKDSGDE